MNPYILYSVTALGVLLALFWMLFIFLGKSIAGTDDKPQTIKYGKLEVTTNSVIGILTASLLTAVLPLCLQFYLILMGLLPPLSPESTSNNEFMSSKLRCESLLGNYMLFTPYEFLNKGDMKATVRWAVWDANACEKGESEGFYRLKGSDITEHQIEFIINGRYEHVATTPTSYSSEVLIGKNGELISRTVHYPEVHPRPKLKKEDLEKLGLENKEVEITRKIDDYVKERDNKHLLLKTRSCDPALFNNGSTKIAFLCLDYIRSMKKLQYKKTAE